MADNKLTKAQQAAEPKKRKRMTVEESPPKGRRAGKTALSAPAGEKKEKKEKRVILENRVFKVFKVSKEKKVSKVIQVKMVLVLAPPNSLMKMTY